MILIFGKAGACWRDEFVKMVMDNIKDKKSVLMADTVRNNATLNYVLNYRKYMNIRPKKCKIRKQFLKYSNGKCYNQVVGMNYIAKVPWIIAQYLLEPCKYTGQRFKLTSATLIVKGGGDITQIKKYGEMEDYQHGRRVHRWMIHPNFGTDRVRNH